MLKMTPVLKNSLRKFMRDERGQDLIEYSLLVAFVAIVGIAFVHGSGMKGIWVTANSTLAAANTSAS